MINVFLYSYWVILFCIWDSFLNLDTLSMNTFVVLRFY